MSRSANFSIIEDTPQRIVLKDIGPWDRHLTITNDAEEVVRRVANRLKGRRLFYYDSEGEMDELLVDQDFGQFVGFAPGPKP